MFITKGMAGSGPNGWYDGRERMADLTQLAADGSANLTVTCTETA